MAIFQLAMLVIARGYIHYVYLCVSMYIYVYHNIYIYIYIYLSGLSFQPLWKMINYSSIDVNWDDDIPNIWKNKKTHMFTMVFTPMSWLTLANTEPKCHKRHPFLGDASSKPCARRRQISTEGKSRAWRGLVRPRSMMGNHDKWSDKWWLFNTIIMMINTIIYN